MITLFGRDRSRAELKARTGDLAQIAGVTLVSLADGAGRGVRALIFRTGSGPEFWVLLDRAFDIGRCQFRSIELGWQSPVGVHAPWFHEVHDEVGASFYRSFSGFLVTCGLDHTGAPHRGSAKRYFAHDRGDIEQPLHGGVATIPAQLVAYGEEWRGERCVLFCEGVVRQVAVAREHLVLTRRYEADLGSSSFTIQDRVRSHSFCPTPHMLLYHIHLGFSLLNAGVEFVPSTRGIRLALRDSRAEGISYRIQPAPRQDCIEQVCVHDTDEDSHGLIQAALINRDRDAKGLGVAVEFSRRQLPYLVQWQNFQSGSYSMAIEPSTLHGLERTHSEVNGDLSWLGHCDERSHELLVTDLSGTEQVDRFVKAARQFAPEVREPFALPREGFGT